MRVAPASPTLVAAPVVVVDNGSSHAGKASVKRLQNEYKNLILVHLPTHASWLNQIEIVFSIIQRKVLTHNNFPSLQAVVETLDAFEDHYNQIAKPFDWNFTREDLANLMTQLDAHEPQLALAA